MGKDYTKTTLSPGIIKLLINLLGAFSRFKSTQETTTCPLSSQSQNFSSWKMTYIMSTRTRWMRRNLIYNMTTITEDQTPNRAEQHRYRSRFVVRSTQNIQTKSSNTLQLSPPCRGELELVAHGRRHLIQFLKSPCIAEPLLTFTDPFGLYSNMYRSILGVYVSWRDFSFRHIT